MKNLYTVYQALRLHLGDPTQKVRKTGEGSILFAGDYVNRSGEYYGFMTQSFRIELFK